MIYLILIALVAMAGVVIWALLERKSKNKTKRKLEIEINNNVALESKLSKVREEVDKVMDYNTEDEDRKKVIKTHVEILKKAGSTEEVVREMDKVRADVHDILATL